MFLFPRSNKVHTRKTNSNFRKSVLLLMFKMEWQI